MSRVGKPAALALIAVLLVACGAEVAPPTSAPISAIPQSSIATVPSLSAPPTTRPTATPTAVPTAKATATIDPAVVFAAFKTAFWTGYGEIYEDDFADALESDYVLVESVDRVSYNEAKNTITIEFTSDFESLYLRDRADWHDDTWEVYRDYSREVWGAIMEGMGDEISGVPLDWPAWTPTFVMTGNKGHLRVSCPGSVIVAIAERQATQTDFEKGCALKPK